MVKFESKQEVMGNVTLTLREFKAGKAGSAAERM